MEINEARRLKELEQENNELKKILAESLLKNRCWRPYAKKSCEPGHRRVVAQELVKNKACSQRAACRICGWRVQPTAIGGEPRR